MATILDTVVEYEDKALETFKSVQEPVVEYVSKAAEFVAARLPEGRPELPVQPAEIVSSQFAFARKALAANEEFVNSILKAVAPVLGTPAKPAAKTVKAA
jgi:hypothetical protein